MKKQNKRQTFPRITLALLLILSMLGNTLILPTVAQETVAPVDNTTSSETPSADEASTDATLTPTLPEPILLTAADIPEFISAAALTERGAVERMRSEETNMSSVIFRNADGTRTMYMYGLPVKYTAMDGTVRDKSTNLVSVSTASVLLSNQPVAQTMAQMSTTQRAALQEELGILDAERATTTLHMLSTALTNRGKSLSDMAYTTLDNDVYALFPTNLAQGMTLVFGEHSVRMTPATGMTVTTGGNVTKTTTTSLTDTDVAERLLYPNVFGPGTAVQYTPTLTGVKEEILLSRNVGKNSFAFLLETGGLILTEQSGQFTLVDPATEQKVGTLGEIIVFDSAGQIVRGSMTAQTILAGQKYGITISVNQEFLANATYPVSIDPTVDRYPVFQDDLGYQYTMIEDVSIYDNEAAVNYTFIEWHQIGQVISTSYQGQAAFRFPMLYDSSIGNGFSALTSDHISSFTLHLKSGISTTTPNVLKASPYVLPWPNTTKIFEEGYFGYYDSSEHDVTINNVPVNSTFSIDLTGMVKRWKDIQHGLANNYSGSPETGVLLWNGSYYGNIWLESVEHSTSIYVTMDYSYTSYAGDFYFNNSFTRTFLYADTETDTLKVQAGTVSSIGSSIRWTVEYEGNDQYSLHPNGQDHLYLDRWGEFTDEKSEYTLWRRSYTDSGVTWTNGLTYITEEEDENGNIIEVEEVLFERVLGVDDSGAVTVDDADEFTNAQMSWRMVFTSNYVELDAISVYIDGSLYTGSTPVTIEWEAQELFRIDYGRTCTFVLSDDFEYYIDSSNGINIGDARLVSGNKNGSTWEGIAYGQNWVYVRHIPTGIKKTIRIFVEGCAGDEPDNYKYHVFPEVEGNPSSVTCQSCRFTISISEYREYVELPKDTDDYPFPTEYNTYPTKNEAVIAVSYEMFRYTIPENATATGYECIAGIYKTVEGRYIVSEYRTSRNSSEVDVFYEYEGVPDNAILIGFVHTHRFGDPDKQFSSGDVENMIDLHHNEEYEDHLYAEEPTRVVGNDVIEARFVAEYVICPITYTTYQIWKLDEFAQSAGEALATQEMVYSNEPQ